MTQGVGLLDCLVSRGGTMECLAWQCGQRLKVNCRDSGCGYC